MEPAVASVSGFADITPDIEAAQMQEESVKASKELIRDHLADHLVRNPNSTYQSWVAVLHPENAHVQLDPRMLTDGNPWLTVWDEVAVRGSSCCPRRLRSNGSEEIVANQGGLIDLTVGALLSGTAAITTVLLDFIGCCLLEMAWLCGALARRLPRAFEPLPLSPPTAVLSAPLLFQTLLQLLFLGGAGVFQLFSVLFAWLLALLQLVFMVVAGTCMLAAVTLREVIALVGLVLCSILALSPAQGWRMCRQIRKVSHATHTAMCNAFVRCIVYSEEHLPTLGDSMRAFPHTVLHTLRSSCRSSAAIAAEDVTDEARSGDGPSEEVRQAWMGEIVQAVQPGTPQHMVEAIGLWMKKSAESSRGAVCRLLRFRNSSETMDTALSDTSEKDVEKQEATSITSRAHELASTATSVLPAVRVYADNALSSSGRAWPLLMDDATASYTSTSVSGTESVLHVSGCEALAALQSEAQTVQIPVQLADANLSVSPACISDSSASAFESAMEEAESNMGSNQLSTNTMEGDAQADRQKRQSKRPIRRGGQWKKNMKKLSEQQTSVSDESDKPQQDVMDDGMSDVPRTDDGWSD